MKSDFGRAVADAADLEDIAACRELGKMELSVRPGGCRSAGSEKRNLDLGQGLAALRIGDDSANVCCDDGSGCGKGAEKGQEGKVKKRQMQEMVWAEVVERRLGWIPWGPPRSVATEQNSPLSINGSSFLSVGATFILCAVQQLGQSRAVYQPCT